MEQWWWWWWGYGSTAALSHGTIPGAGEACRPLAGEGEKKLLVCYVVHFLSTYAVNYVVLRPVMIITLLTYCAIYGHDRDHFY